MSDNKGLITRDDAEKILNKSLASRFSHMRTDDELKWSREKMFMLRHLEKSRKLRECEPNTIADAMLTCAVLGLSINPELGHTYPVPFRNKALNRYECALWVGYQGMEHVLYKDGGVQLIQAHIVWQDEYDSGAFKYTYGTNPDIQHRPLPRSQEDLKDDEGAWGAYAVITMANGQKAVEVIDRARMMLIKSCAKTKDFWEGKFWFQQWRKSAVRAAYKHLPKTPTINTLETTMRQVEPMVFDEPDEAKKKQRKDEDKEPVVVLSENDILTLHSKCTDFGIDASASNKWLARLANSEGYDSIESVPAAMMETMIEKLVSGLKKWQEGQKGAQQ